MLNEFGKLAIAVIIAYIPLLFVSFFITLRYGFSRRTGWILLVVFSTIRIVGGVLTIVTQQNSNPSTGLLITTGIVQALGLSPLLMSTLSFVSNIVRHGLPSFTRLMRLLHILLTVGIILAVVGGTKQSPDNSISDQNSGHTYSRIGSICFMAGYLAITGLIVLLWGAKDNIPVNHRKFLFRLTVMIPFLAVRVAYSIIGAFSSSAPEHPSEWSPTAGNWKIYLFMALIMEYTVCCTYVISGITISLENEEPQSSGGSFWELPTYKKVNTL